MMIEVGYIDAASQLKFTFSLPYEATSFITGLPNFLLESYYEFVRGVRRGFNDIADKIASGGAR